MDNDALEFAKCFLITNLWGRYDEYIPSDVELFGMEEIIDEISRSSTNSLREVLEAYKLLLARLYKENF